MLPQIRSARRSVRLASGLVSALLLSPLASAQTAPSPTPGANATGEVVELSQFVVSSQGDTGYFAKNTLAGTRANERLVNIPQNIQIINSEFLQDVNLDNGVDAFKYGASGINKKEATSGDTYIRGFRVGGNSFLRNGVKFRGNLNIPLYDIDRIEIIKGPAALLFGGDAGSGGVVNYIAKPAADRTVSTAKLTTGSFNLLRGEASTTGPVRDAGLTYRATVAASDSDWRRRFDYFKDTFFSLATDYKVSNTTKVSAYYTYYFVDQLVSTESTDTLGRFLNIPRDFSPQEAWAEAPRHTQYGNLVLNTAFTPTLTARIFANWSQQNFDFHQVFNARNPDAVTGLMNRTYQNYTGKERQANFQGDMFKSFATGPVGHKVTWGATVKFQRLNQNVDNAPLPAINVYTPVYGAAMPQITRTRPLPGGSVSAPLNRSREDFMYIHEQAALFRGKLILVGGLSYNGVDTTRLNRINNALTQQVDDAIVKRYGAVFKPVDWASLYYNYSESFQFFNNIFIGGPRNGEILDPSYTGNNEFGVKAETSDGRLFGSVVFFDLDKTNVVVAYTQPDGTPGTRQSGFEVNKGWEADIGVGFTSPLGAGQAILTWYRGGSKDVNGLLPVGVTNKMWSAFVNQAVGSGPLKGVRFGGGVYFKDAFTLPRGSGQTVTFVAPSYTTTTAFVSYRASRWGVALNVDNLADKYYVDGGDSSGAMNMALGRTFKVTLDYRF